MVSTISSAGWPASSIARRIAAMSLVVPVEVSLWTTMTDLMRLSLSAASFSPTAAASTGWRQSPATQSTSSPSPLAMRRHRMANWPVSNINTRSPAECVLTSAASHAPVPDDA